METICFSRSGRRRAPARSSWWSHVVLQGRITISPSVPETSDSSSSLPSQSVLIGSSSETSVFWLAILRMCMRISFSMQREGIGRKLDVPVGPEGIDRLDQTDGADGNQDPPD